MPNFWLSIVRILVFSVNLGWFSSVGYVLLADGFWPWLRHLLLPAFTTGIAFAAIMTRMARSTMLEVLNELYVSTARSKGLPERVVVLKQALRNALIPVATAIGIAFKPSHDRGARVAAGRLFGRLPGVGGIGAAGPASRLLQVVGSTSLSCAISTCNGPFRA